MVIFIFFKINRVKQVKCRFCQISEVIVIIWVDINGSLDQIVFGVDENIGQIQIGVEDKNNKIQ